MSNPAPTTQSPDQSIAYLDSLLNKTLHLHTSDGRVFVGQMKCTDNELNIILSMTYEYRRSVAGGGVVGSTTLENLAGNAVGEGGAMKKRFVGLVVVPGRFVERIDVEE
ncbi:LSM domain protein [Neohortaea acidophila]|uniref:LSM domain protein n=1 Tax=Neohortaea acidophila TaxID=245834 RepID=A0A6A6PW48_9PEZI|nr:LSM domain protein [Neohortaea acidophila]KAF2483899.1 LSM domain protein [Neohortaea acidophila]